MKNQRFFIDELVRRAGIVRKQTSQDIGSMEGGLDNNTCLVQLRAFFAQYYAVNVFFVYIFLV